MTDRVIVKLVRDLSEREVRDCCALTLPRGSMRPALQNIRRSMQPHVRNVWMLRALETETVIMIRRQRRLIAWALIQCVRHPRVPAKLFMYVDPAFRRQGLGSRLLAFTQERWENISVFPWDDISLDFYENAGMEDRYDWGCMRWAEERKAARTVAATPAAA